MVIFLKVLSIHQSLQLHAYEVGCFNYGKLNKGVQFGRVYQLGRTGGNFLFVGECTSTYMPDAQSLPLMLNTHEHLFGKGLLASVATDKGYYSLSNEQLLIEKGVLEIQLPRPDRTLNAARETTPWPIRQLLHHRRTGYAAVFGFNLRQLTRYLSGEVRPEIDKMSNIAANNANSTYKTVIQGA